MKRFSTWLMAVTGLVMLAQVAQAAAPLFEDKVVAKGKGVEVKQSAVDEAIIALKASMAAQGQQFPEAKRDALQTNILDRLVMTQLIVARGTAEDQLEAKKQAEKFVDEVKKRLPNEEAFKRRLDANGMKPETFMARAQEEALVKIVVDREVANKVTISEETAKKYYDDNLKAFDQPEMVKASHILLVTLESGTRTEIPEEKKKEKRALADKVLARAKAGEDFAALAKEFSEDLGSKDRGGEYTFPKGRMVPEFEAAAFSLMPGQISEVVTSQFGYHIIKVQEKIAPRTIPYTEVAARIKDGLRAQETQKQLPDYYKKLKEDAGVQFFFGEKK
jgi:peptidyl-prolyl cis-trans isomerase C